MNTGREGKAKSLADLPREIAPPHDLWPGIERALGKPAPARVRSFGWPPLRAVAGLAALVVALGLGVWIGRGFVPGVRLASNAQPGSQMTKNVAYVSDPRYQRQHAELMQVLSKRLAQMPPASRQQVLQSLATIHQSMQQLESALGHDPSNALLQDLLVNTYQDEMRVLTLVEETSATGAET
jgi:hypothetical protein